MSEKKEIKVYAHWERFKTPVLMGILSVAPVRGKEIFSFEYTREWLKSDFTYLIDPDLQMYSGRYFPREEKLNFGAFWKKVVRCLDSYSCCCISLEAA